MTFEDWSKDCEHKDSTDVYCFMLEEGYCAEDNCPRYDEYIADLEAHQYDSYLEHQLHRRLDRDI